MSVRINLEIGHEASIRTKQTPEGFTHDWELFVRGCDGAEIHYFIEKVVFYLHETFPKPRRVIKEPPYSVKESGYAGFTLPIDIYLRNKDEPKKIKFNYDLNLQPSGPAIIKVQKEKFVFDNLNEDFKYCLLKSGGTVVNSSSNVQDNSEIKKSSGVNAISANGDKTQQFSTKPRVSTSSSSSSTITNNDTTIMSSSTMKKSKPKLEDPKDSFFANVFGTPITKVSNKNSGNVSAEPSKNISSSTSATNQSSSSSKDATKKSNSSSSKEKGGEKDKSKSKSPTKDRDKDSDRLKERDKSTETSADRKTKDKEKNKEKERRNKDKDHESRSGKERSKDKEKQRSHKENSMSAAGASASLVNNDRDDSSPKRTQSPMNRRPPSPPPQAIKRPLSPLVQSASKRPSSPQTSMVNNNQNTGPQLQQQKLSSSYKDRVSDEKKSDGASGHKERSKGEESGKKSKKEKRDRDRDKEKEYNSEKHKDKEKLKDIKALKDMIREKDWSPIPIKSDKKEKSSSKDYATSNKETNATTLKDNEISSLVTNTTSTTQLTNAALSNETPTAAATVMKTTNKDKTEEKKERHKHKKKDKDKKEKKEREDKEKSHKSEKREKVKSSAKYELKEKSPVEEKVYISPKLDTPSHDTKSSSSSLSLNTNHRSSSSTISSSTINLDTTQSKPTPVAPFSTSSSNTNLSSGMTAKRSTNVHTMDEDNENDMDENADEEMYEQQNVPSSSSSNSIGRSNKPNETSLGSSMPTGSLPSGILQTVQSVPIATVAPMQHQQANDRDRLGRDISDEQSSSRSGLSTSTKGSSRQAPTDTKLIKDEKKNLEERRGDGKDKDSSKQEREKSKQKREKAKKKDKKSDKEEKKRKRKPDTSIIRNEDSDDAGPPEMKLVKDDVCDNPSRDDNEEKEPDTKQTTKEADKGNQENPEEYMKILRELQQKIMTLQDNSELQKVVQLIAETGRYEVSARTFDFDLCLLERSTVRRLQEFFSIP